MHNLMFVLIVAAMAVSIVGFILGYAAANVAEREAVDMLKAHLNMIKRQKMELSQWVEKNWPTEYAAYTLGHTEGYQQGVLQGPDLEDDQQ